MAENTPKRKKVTIRELQRKMREKEQIVQLAVYDYRNAVIADRLRCGYPLRLRYGRNGSVWSQKHRHCDIRRSYVYGHGRRSR